MAESKMRHYYEKRGVYVAYCTEDEDLCYGEADTLKEALRLYGHKEALHHINYEIDEYEDDGYIDTIERTTVWKKGDEI